VYFLIALRRRHSSFETPDERPCAIPSEGLQAPPRRLKGSRVLVP
jgi:hypothetical protein